MRALLLISACWLTGCAAGWVKPGASEQEFYQARFECEQRAAAMFPTAIAKRPTYTTAQNTNCRVNTGTVNCTTQPGVAYGGQQYDANANARANAFASCMRAEGWAFKIN